MSKIYCAQCLGKDGKCQLCRLFDAYKGKFPVDMPDGTRRYYDEGLLHRLVTRTAEVDQRADEERERIFREELGL